MSELTATGAAESAAAPKASLWEDFVDILYAPSRVFARRRDGRFGLALTILTAINAAVFFAVRPLLQPLFDRGLAVAIEQLARQPDMTPDKVEAARGTIERFANLSMYAGAVVGTPLLVFLVATLLWGAARLLDVRLSWGQAATVTTYANVPRVITGALGGLVMLVVDADQLPTLQQAPLGPVALLGRDASPYLVALLGRLDLGTVWVTVLLGIGTAVVARTTRGRGMTAAGIVWVVATLFALFNALRAAAAGG